MALFNFTRAVEVSGNYFVHWVREHKTSRNWGADPDRFTSAVEAHFDDVEAWHEKNGSLHQQIG